ncbi:hypothetical protein BDZ91DRAFT_801540 [Kalaharituber pfeilii]|nr:hypothetical protein BDZ91DRAFT_801540 [Kalaharituber pfeilii]
MSFWPSRNTTTELAFFPKPPREQYSEEPPPEQLTEPTPTTSTPPTLRTTPTPEPTPGPGSKKRKGKVASAQDRNAFKCQLNDKEAERIAASRAATAHSGQCSQPARPPIRPPGLV